MGSEMCIRDSEYIAAIFDCYKSLVKHFKRYGFMKKVYETTREFETAVRSAFSMVPTEQLDAFLSVFEEARYSDHSIDATHRDWAVQTLDAIVRSHLPSLLAKVEWLSAKRLSTSMTSRPRLANLLPPMELFAKQELLKAKAQISKFESENHHDSP